MIFMIILDSQIQFVTHHHKNCSYSRYFFEPNATETNKIPVVNKNLSSQQVFLDNFDAPHSQ